jgi:hypothetical protein
MGYDLHISRAEDWSDNADAPITLGEWTAIATADADLVLDRENGEGFYLVRGLREDGGDAWFDWFDGDVFTKNPDRATLAKMLELADRIDGKVQGDDGELYDSPGDLGV